ncbi:MAG: M15 family metallopeptidase [Dehalobacterium sp.]
MRNIYSLILTFVLLVPLVYFYFISGAGYTHQLTKVEDLPNLSLQQETICELEEKLKRAGLVDIQSIDSSIKVALMYSSSDNFLKYDIYGCLEKGYLYKVAALKLAKAQKYLKELYPDYSLLVCDAVRPLSVQYKMWEIVKDTSMRPYIANPDGGSMHNYGAAVDITIIDSHGAQLDMGTPVDFFEDLSQPVLEEQYLFQKKLTQEQLANRRLLRSVMEQAGFIGISNEWWHFDAFEKNWIRKNLKIIP